MPVVTTTVPATARPSRTPYGIAHDGLHWSGSFNKLLTAFLTDLIEEAPLELTFDLYREGDDTLHRTSGQVVAVTPTAITFEDGHVLDRVGTDVIAAWVTNY